MKYIWQPFFRVIPLFTFTCGFYLTKRRRAKEAQYTKVKITKNKEEYLGEGESIIE